MTRTAFVTFITWLALSVPALAQITIPHPNFVPGTVIDSEQVDANNAALSSQALNRTGGTMSGTLTSLALLPNVHDTYDIGTTGTRYQDLFLSGLINVSGNVTVDTTTLFVNATTNRVGIGTVSPGRELTISGSAPGLELASTGGGITWALTSGTSGTLSIFDSADSVPILALTSLGDINASTSGNNQRVLTFTNTSAGASASGRISVINDAGIAAYMELQGSGVVGFPSGVSIGATGASGISIGADHASGVFRLNAGAATRWTLLSTGHLEPNASATYNIGSTSSVANSIFGTRAFLGDTSNADSTQGLTINQAANDDDIISVKSSDVAHGLSGETDTYGAFRKASSTLGGLNITGSSEATSGAALQLFASAAIGSGDTTKSAAANGYVDVRAFRNSTSVGANENLLVIRNANATAFIFDAEGDAHNDGTTWTAYDSFDDLALIDTLDHVLDPTLRALGRIDLDASRAWLTEARLVSFDAEGRPFVNTTRLQMLHNGALRQMSDRIAGLEAEIAALKARPQ